MARSALFRSAITIATLLLTFITYAKAFDDVSFGSVGDFALTELDLKIRDSDLFVGPHAETIDELSAAESPPHTPTSEARWLRSAILNIPDQETRQIAVRRQHFLRHLEKCERLRSKGRRRDRRHRCDQPGWLHWQPMRPGLWQSPFRGRHRLFPGRRLQAIEACGHVVSHFVHR